MNDDEVRTAIIDHLTKNPGVDIHYKTLGTDAYQGSRVYAALFEEGLIEHRKVPSASGKTMQTRIFLREQKKDL